MLRDWLSAALAVLLPYYQRLSPPTLMLLPLIISLDVFYVVWP